MSKSSKRARQTRSQVRLARALERLDAAYDEALNYKMPGVRDGWVNGRVLGGLVGGDVTDRQIARGLETLVERGVLSRMSIGRETHYRRNSALEQLAAQAE